jgi:hypothetical protein
MLKNLSLILDLLEWIDKHPRSYEETMDAWRTSCPRLPIWEDACDHDLVERQHRQYGVTMVVLTPAGKQLLAAKREISGVSHSTGLMASSHQGPSQMR